MNQYTFQFRGVPLWTLGACEQHTHTVSACCTSEAYEKLYDRFERVSDLYLIDFNPAEAPDRDR